MFAIRKPNHLILNDVLILATRSNTQPKRTVHCFLRKTYAWVPQSLKPSFHENLNVRFSNHEQAPIPPFVEEVFIGLSSQLRVFIVPPVGLEPTTVGLKVRYSTN